MKDSKGYIKQTKEGEGFSPPTKSTREKSTNHPKDFTKEEGGYIPDNLCYYSGLRSTADYMED